MFNPTYEEFIKCCNRGNMVPVYKEYLADMDTPVSVLSRFVDDNNVFLLESVEGGENWGRYSFIGVNPYAVFKVENGVPYFCKDGKTTALPIGADGPFAALRQIVDRNRVVEIPELPRFFAGAIGYIGYNTVREFERLPEPKRPLSGPTSCLMLTNEMIVFDNVRHSIKIVCCARLDEFTNSREAYNYACNRILALEAIMKKPALIDGKKAARQFDPETLASNVSREEFCNMVTRAKTMIEEGEIIQTVLSQRFSTPLTVHPLQLYRALRLINPSPYMFFLKFGGENKMLIGSSPEVMARKNGSRVMLRPIAGTRPRGDTEQIDRALADELLRDEKERAEHLMLVDLGRNDLGRIATPASVQVKDFMTIEKYSHVMHLVSNVEAEMRHGCDSFDLLNASFPAGTLSGAPKIRAMEIINELEPEPRDAYGGAVGYIGFNGNMDMAITIRTFEIDRDVVSVQAGAGIVYDSDPETEYKETRHKAQALFKALKLAADGLEL